MNSQQSYISDSPPFQRRTSQLYNQQVAEINSARTKSARETISKQYGLVLNKAGSAVQPHGATLLPYLDEHVMDNVTIDECHDEYLGPWPEHFYLSTFYWTRTDKAGNHFTFEALEEHWGAYPWKATMKSDIPKLCKKYAGRDMSKGVQIFGPQYEKGWPIPLQEHPFQLTSAAALTLCIHSVALLEPLITNKEDPLWICLCEHQRTCLSRLKYSASIRELFALDTLSDKWHGLFLALWMLAPFYKPKYHNQRHGPERYITTGPGRLMNCIKAEQALRLPKNDVMSSNWNNPLLTMATRSSERVAWTVQSTWEEEVTSGEYLVYTELLGESHILFPQLGLDSTADGANVTWYRRIEHQGVTCEEGKMGLLLGEDQQVFEVKSGLCCGMNWYLVVNPFDKHPNGDPCKVTAEGLMHVSPHMQQLEVQLIHMRDASIVPLIAAHSSTRVLLVDEV